MLFVLEPRVSLETVSLSLGIEARSVYIPHSPDPISSLLFVGFTGYGCYTQRLDMICVMRGHHKVRKSRFLYVYIYITMLKLKSKLFV
ncbi:hypothetical protein HanIR_Chr02g0066521 [Helianthus annuus]|nr:hypothetical protein HanIR_Chr02g0066521 [Helianthus annuus]